MPTIILDQDDVVEGADVLGSRDGVFGLHIGVVDWIPGLTGYGVGHQVWPKSFFATWHRFKLPIPKNAIIKKAYFTFKWYRQWPGHYKSYNYQPLQDPSCIGITGVGPDDVTPLGTSEDVTYPKSKTEAIAFLDAGIAADQTVSWCGGALKYDYGQYGAPVVTPDCTSIIQKLVDQTAWVEDTHAVFFMYDSLYLTETLSDFTDLLWMHNRWWFWFSWSLVYLGQSVDWELPEVKPTVDLIPTLTIEYELNTPVPSGADKHVEHTLTFIQEPDHTDIPQEDTAHVLSFTQTITQVTNYNFTLEHSLFFDQTYVPVSNTQEKAYTDMLVFNQEIVHGLVVTKDLEHTLSFDQIIEGNNDTVQMEQQTLDVVQTITYTQVHTKAIEHTLTFTQDYETPRLQINVNHDLFLSQTITNQVPLVVKSPEQQLTFVQTITPVVFLNIAVEHTLSFTQGFLAVNPATISGTCSRADLLYQPYTMSLDFSSLTTLGDGLGVTLSYPYTSPTHSVTLPSPLMGNQEEFLLTVVQHKTRGGKLITYRDTTWPTEQIFRMGFGGLSDDQFADLFALFGASLGQPVKLEDHEGRTWKVLLVNPNGESAQIYRSCGHTAEFHVKVI